MLSPTAKSAGHSCASAPNIALTDFVGCAGATILTSTSADCHCSMYCNYCDKTHREQFQLTAYSSNSTYDADNLPRCTDDLYNLDDKLRNYEAYMDYYCDALYDTSELSNFFAVSCAPALHHT